MGICVSSQSNSPLIAVKTETIPEILSSPNEKFQHSIYQFKGDISTSTSISCFKSSLISNRNISPEISILKEINTARINPKAYSIKISNLQSFIKLNPLNNKHYLAYNDHSKIKLKTGKQGIKQCIEYLLSLKQNYLSPLIYNKEISMPFPDNSDLYFNKEYLQQQIDILKSKYKGKYTIIDFQYEINSDPIMSVISQIIDDTNSNYQRRYNIFKENVKYIGINYEEIKNGMYIYYFIFAK